MATALSLALRITGDASGLKLTPVERALKQLETQTQSLTAVFKQFQGDSAAAGEAQKSFATDLAFLNSALRTGKITAEEFAKEYEALSVAIKAETDSFKEAARVIAENTTPLQKYETEFRRLTELVRAGKIDQDVYNSAVEKARAAYNNATGGASQFDKVLESQKLKFNELSGIFAALPGPLGNIAGRFSGIASASEGLTRVFDGKLSQGISAVATSFAALVNPVTVALAGVAAFGAAASAIANGLVALEDRVEKLGNTADKLGVSFEFIQTLEEAARRSGTSIDAVSAAFGRLQKSVLGVDEESKAAQKALAEIGVTSEELAALSPEQQYLKIGEALAGIEDPARRTATATALFGKSGADLLPFFRNIEGASTDMERFAAALSDAERVRIDSLGSSLDSVIVALRGAGQELLTPFIGITQSIADGLAPAIAALGKNIGAILDFLSPVTSVVGAIANVLLQLSATILNVIGEALEPFGAAGRVLADGFDIVSRSVTKVFAVINDFVRGFNEGVLATVGSWLGFETGAAKAEEQTKKVGEAAKELTKEQQKALDDLNKAFADSNKSLDDAISKSAEFGQAGFEAALDFQNALKDLQEQAAEGEFNAEQYARGVALAEAEYQKQIESLKQIQEETKKAADEAQRRVDADKSVADQLLEQQRIAQEFGGDSERAKAADAALATEREITRLREVASTARDTGDAEAAAAAERRVEQLQIIGEEQRRIADGSAKAAAEEAKRLEDQQKRVDALLQSNDSVTKFEQQLADVQQQIALAEAEQAKAREANNQATADAAAARVAELDQLQAKLEESLQAAEQGFGEGGFGEAFRKVNEDFTKLNEKALEFGQAGFDAALRLQDGIRQAQEQARSGILNQEGFDQEVARQQKLFENEIKNIDEANKARIKAGEEATKAQEKAQSDALRQQEKAEQDIAKTQEQAQQQYLQQQQKAFEERKKAEEAEFARQAERLRELNTLGSQVIQGTDVRTQEGASLVLNLAANAQDPQLIANRILTKINTNLIENLRRIGTLALIN